MPDYQIFRSVNGQKLNQDITISVATDTIFDAKGDLVAGTGANAAAKLAVGADGDVLTVDSGETSGLKWAAPSGGGGTPGGADTNVQYNDSGSFGGEASFVYNKTTNTLTVDKFKATSATSYFTNGFNGGMDEVFVNGGIFRTTEYSLFGTNDIFFQLTPITGAGYGILEAGGAKLALSTDGQDILFMPNRVEKMRLAPNTGVLTLKNVLEIPASSSTAGHITQGSSRFIHSYGTVNAFFGLNSGNFTLSGAANTGIGASSMKAITSGHSSTGIGYNTLAAMTTGTYNVAIGRDVLSAVTTGSSNTAVGGNCLTAFNGSDATAYGYSAHATMTTGDYNTAVGRNSSATLTSGGSNTSVGAYASNSSSTGSNNTVVGTSAFYDATTSGNTAIGSQAGRGLVTPVNNTFVGYLAGYGLGTTTDGLSNAAAFGYNAQVTASNAIILGNGASVAIDSSSITAPLARLHLPAGTASANTAPLKIKSGTKLTTAEAGVHEYNGNHLLTNSAVRFPVGGVLFDHYADAGNVGTGEDDLYSDTCAASTLAANGDKVTGTFQGIFAGAVASTQELRIYFAGTKIYDSGALAIGVATNSWMAQVTVIRESSSVVRCSVAISTDFATLFPYSSYTRITGLTLTNTQIIKLTGEAAGAGAANDQIVAKLGYVEFKPGA